MRNTRFGLPFHLLALATLGPQLLSEEGGDDDNNGGGGGGGPAPVPYDRFKSVNDKLNTSRSRITELESEVQSLTEKSATVDTLASTLKSKEESWGLERSGLQERLGLSELGLTSQEGQTVARSLYGSLDEETRGKVAFTDQVKAWKEAPDTAPAGLKPYLGGEAGGTGGGAGGRNANKGADGGGNGGGSGGAGAVTLEALQAARTKAIKTNDWKEYNTLCAAAQ